MNRLAAAFLLCAALSGVGGYGATYALMHAKPRDPALAKDAPSYRDVVKQVLPAVVSIEARPRAALSRASLPPELRKHLEPFGGQPLPDSHPGRAFGSGFVVDPSGVILTNDHVVRDAEELEVHLQDGRKFTTRDFKTDPKSDLAVVRIQVKGELPSLKLGDSDEMEVGDRVLAVGAPLGLTGTVTSGIISAKARDVHMNLDEDFLQTDAAINPGNSGGPLVNLAGEVIGINSAIKSQTGGFQGIGLAISSNLAKNVMEHLLKDGMVHRGYLGVQVQPLDPEVAARLGLAGKTGVVVAKVMAGAPAAKAGLRDGDIVTEVAGQPVKDPRGLQKIVAGLPAGKSVELGVYSDGAPKSLTVTVEEQPQLFGRNTESAEPEAVSLGKLGVRVKELTAEKARELGHPEKTEGVLVTEVDPNGVAGEAGMRSGTVILKVDQQRVRTVEEYQKAVEKASLDEGVLLQVRTAPGGTTYVLLKAPASR
jgi:serine protease Do